MDIPALSMNFDMNQGGLVSFGSDDKLHVSFSSKSMLDPLQSKEQGRPVHASVDFVRIQQPGERDFIERPAHNGDVQRFPRQWQAYQNGKQDQPDGTPLAVLFPNNPEIVDNLKYFKIFVVEQLASLTDTQKQNIGMGSQTFCDRAKKFLDAAEKGKGFHELQAQMEAMNLKIQELTDKNRALEAAVAESDEGEAPRRRGRPPKQHEAA